MKRFIEIALEKRNVRCVAQLLDEQAPRTCEAVWSALPQSGDIVHAKYASNELYILVHRFAGEEPGPENQTIVPGKGDVLYFYLHPGTRLPEIAKEVATVGKGVIDLAVFYDRDNLLLSPREGFTPGNVFASIVRTWRQ